MSRRREFVVEQGEIADLVTMSGVVGPFGPEALRSMGMEEAAFFCVFVGSAWDQVLPELGERGMPDRLRVGVPVEAARQVVAQMPSLCDWALRRRPEWLMDALARWRGARWSRDESGALPMN